MAIAVELSGIDAAALEVLAECEGISPDHLLRDLIRDAALSLVTGRPRRWGGEGEVRLVGQHQAGQEEAS